MSDGKKEEISQVHILNIWIRGNCSIPVVSWTKCSSARMCTPLPQKKIVSSKAKTLSQITLNN
jgi:hypothetical protein